MCVLLDADVSGSEAFLGNPTVQRVIAFRMQYHWATVIRLAPCFVVHRTLSISLKSMHELAIMTKNSCAGVLCLCSRRSMACTQKVVQQ